MGIFHPDNSKHLSPISQTELPYASERLDKLESTLREDAKLRAVIDQLKACTSPQELSAIVNHWNESEGKLWTGAHVEKVLSAHGKDITIMLDRDSHIRLGAIWRE